MIARLVRARAPEVPDEGVTVRVASPAIWSPLWSVPVAVMVTLQLGTQSAAAAGSTVASPEALTLTSVGSLDTQAAELVRFTLVGVLLKVPMAMNWAVCPGMLSDWVPGSTVTETRSRAPPPPPPAPVAEVTVISEVPVMPP